MPCPLLTPENLAVGLANFLGHPKWRQDLHNTFYSQVTHAVKIAGGFGGASVGAYHAANALGPLVWHDIVLELQTWKALRPQPTAAFNEPPGLPALEIAYHAFGAGLPYTPLPVGPAPQPVISTLFNSAAALKVVQQPSAVFASKCCHMILPWEFPVWDNAFVGNNNATRIQMIEALDDWEELNHQTAVRLGNALGKAQLYPTNYWTYREFILTAWDTLPAPDKAILIAQLNAAIAPPGAPNPVWAHFPYRTKIPELCLA